MNHLTVPILNNMCKRRNIKNISRCKKQELVSKLGYYNSIIKIQKWFRKKLIQNEVCPISLEKIEYPCYAYCPSKHRFIYYNLDSLKTFLISTGDFRDPKTRNAYTNKQLLEIGKDVYRASKNVAYYKRKKERENEMLFLERYMDELTQEMIELIEKVDIYKLDTIYFYSYKRQYEKLRVRSAEHADYILKKSIKNINFVIDKGIEKKIYNHKQMFLRDHIVQFLYSIEM